MKEEEGHETKNRNERDGGIIYVIHIFPQNEQQAQFRNENENGRALSGRKQMDRTTAGSADNGATDADDRDPHQLAT